MKTQSVQSIGYILLRSQLRYTVSYFLSMPNAYITGISLIIPYVIRGRAKKTGPIIEFFSLIFCSFFAQKPLHLVVTAFYFLSLPRYVIIFTVSTCVGTTMGRQRLNLVLIIGTQFSSSMFPPCIFPLGLKSAAIYVIF